MKLWSSFDRKEGPLYLRPQIWIWMFVCGGHFVFTSGDLELNTPGDYSGSFDPLNCLIFRKDGTCPWPLVERPRQRNRRVRCQQHNCVEEEGVCVCAGDWGGIAGPL